MARFHPRTATAASSGGITDITYADLVTAIGASTLTAGQYYRITDYATKHYIVDGDLTQYTVGDGIITGTAEPLVVLAIDTDEISTLAYSQTYPQDIIYYDWDPANWLADLSFATGGDTIISGFTGVITFRHDTQYDNYAPGDWRNCKTRRWKTDATEWSAGTDYVVGDVVKYTIATIERVYMACKAGTNHVPGTTYGEYWIVIHTLTDYLYRNASPSSWLGVPSGVDYQDFLLFVSGQPKTMHIGPTSVSGYSWLCNSVIFDCSECFDCSINNSFVYNTICGIFYSNFVNDKFAANTTNQDYDGNVIGSCSSNLFGYTFNRNEIAIQFSSNVLAAFTNNAVGIGFQENKISGPFSGNRAASGFASNSISTSCADNNFGASFIGNILDVGFQYNNTADSAVSSVDFTGATHVYAAYNTELYLDATLGLRLTYRDNDVDIFVAATA